MDNGSNKNTKRKVYVKKTVKETNIGAPLGNTNALKYSDEKYIPLVRKYYDEMLADKRYPSDEYLSVYLDISIDTIFEWLETHPCFRRAVAQGRQKAMQALVDRSLNGEWNDRFAALVLKNRHGFVDKMEQKVEADVGVKVVFTEED